MENIWLVLTRAGTGDGERKEIWCLLFTMEAELGKKMCSHSRVAVGMDGPRGAVPGCPGRGGRCATRGLQAWPSRATPRTAVRSVSPLQRAVSCCPPFKRGSGKGLCPFCLRQEVAGPPAGAQLHV